MKKVSSLFISSILASSLYAGDFSMNLKQGWNIVSIPVAGEYSVDEVKAKFGSDATLKVYRNGVWLLNDKDIKNISSYEGMYVYLPKSRVVTYSGSDFMTKIPTTYESEWGLVGAGSNTDIASLSSNIEEAMGYNMGTWDAYPNGTLTTIDRGQGFWVKTKPAAVESKLASFVNEDVNIKLISAENREEVLKSLEEKGAYLSTPSIIGDIVTTVNLEDLEIETFEMDETLEVNQTQEKFSALSDASKIQFIDYRGTSKKADDTVVVSTGGKLYTTITQTDTLGGGVTFKIAKFTEKDSVLTVPNFSTMLDKNYKYITGADVKVSRDAKDITSEINEKIQTLLDGNFSATLTQAKDMLGDSFNNLYVLMLEKDENGTSSWNEKYSLTKEDIEAMQKEFDEKGVDGKQGKPLLNMHFEFKPFAIATKTNSWIEQNLSFDDDRGTVIVKAKDPESYNIYTYMDNSGSTSTTDVTLDTVNTSRRDVMEAIVTDMGVNIDNKETFININGSSLAQVVDSIEDAVSKAQADNKKDLKIIVINDSQDGNGGLTCCVDSDCGACWNDINISKDLKVNLSLVRVLGDIEEEEKSDTYSEKTGEMFSSFIYEAPSNVETFFETYHNYDRGVTLKEFVNVERVIAATECTPQQNGGINCNVKYPSKYDSTLITGVELINSEKHGGEAIKTITKESLIEENGLNLNSVVFSVDLDSPQNLKIGNTLNINATGMNLEATIVNLENSNFIELEKTDENGTNYKYTLTAKNAGSGAIVFSDSSNSMKQIDINVAFEAPLSLNSIVATEAGKSVTINAENVVGGLTATSTDETIATVETNLVDNSIRINGLTAGETTINVSDSREESVTVKVTIVK
jgi:hypothetical protein